MIMFSDDELRRIEKMIKAHEIQTGEAPKIIQLPLPKEMFLFGVRASFYLGNEYYTCSNGKSIHHLFLEHKS